MIVVADTSPLNYLLLIRSDWILRELYEKVVVPRAVFRELSHQSTPSLVKTWVESLPVWVEVRATSADEHPELSYLGDGEREAIVLAETIHPDFVLMDDLQGRTEAERRGIPTTGTLGVLLAAERAGLLSARDKYFELLRETNFRHSAVVEAKFLANCRVH